MAFFACLVLFWSLQKFSQANCEVQNVRCFLIYTDSFSLWLVSWDHVNHSLCSRCANSFSWAPTMWMARIQRKVSVHGWHPLPLLQTFTSWGKTPHYYIYMNLNRNEVEQISDPDSLLFSICRFQELDLSKEAFLFNDTPKEPEWMLAVYKGLHPDAKYALVRTSSALSPMT